MVSNISIITFSQLKSENLRLKNELNFTNKCLDILIKFKNNLIDILNERSYSSVVYLKSDQIQVFEDLNIEYNKILTENPEFGIKSKTNDLKTINRWIQSKKDSELKQLSENQNMIKIISFENNKSNERQITPNINQLKPNIKTYSKQKPMTTTTNNPIQKVLMSVISTQKECHNVKIALKCSIDSCRQIFYCESDLREHIQKIHNKSFIKCIINFDPKSESRAQPLLRQPLSGNKSINNDSNKYKCDYDLCEKSFPSKFLLNHHILCIHKNVRPFKCDFPNCNKTFRRNTTLLAHNVCHSSEKPFECNFKDCKYRAKTKSRLITHLNMTHNDFRPFDCEVKGCGLKFKTYSCLQSHMSYKHSNKPSVKCSFTDCQKLVRPHKMKEHLRFHKKQPISCVWPGCQYTTKMKRSMDTHMTQTHSSERNYVCDWPQCGKRFKTKNCLRLHSRSHSNERPYSCDWPDCPFKAKNPHYLKRHLRIHTKEKPYPCQWPGCEYRCSFGPNLKKHMKVHTKC